MSASWAGGSTRAWRTLREAILTRDRADARRTGQPWCRVRIPGVCIGESDPMHAHHTRGKAITGDDPRYIVAACSPCNLHVGDPSRGEDPPCRPVTRWK